MPLARINHPPGVLPLLFFQVMISMDWSWFNFQLDSFYTCLFGKESASWTWADRRKQFRSMLVQPLAWLSSLFSFLLRFTWQREGETNCKGLSNKFIQSNISKNFFSFFFHIFSFLFRSKTAPPTEGKTVRRSSAGPAAVPCRAATPRCGGSGQRSMSRFRLNVFNVYKNCRRVFLQESTGESVIYNAFFVGETTQEVIVGH